MRLSQRVVAPIVWVVSIALLGVGYARVEMHDASRLASVEDDVRTLRIKIARAESIVHDRLALRAARARIVTDIRAQASYGSRDDLGPMLASLDRATRRSQIALVSIEPKSAAPIPARDRWLRARGVRLILRGSFGRFLSFLPAFSVEDPLVSVRGIEITSNDSGAAVRPLTFAIDADAYSLDDPNHKE